MLCNEAHLSPVMKLTYHPCCAEYLGGAITCDAYHMTDPRADGLGVSTCIELALKDAGIEKEQVHRLLLCAERGEIIAIAFALSYPKGAITTASCIPPAPLSIVT